jgi:signal transduction histidine kinase
MSDKSIFSTLTNVFNEALEGVLIVDASGKVIFINNTASKLLEFKFEEILVYVNMLLEKIY